jgi:ATP-binding protein involved in chromosome partitioning
MSISEAAILDALRAVREPELPGDIVSRDMVRGLTIDGTRVAFTIELTTPACPLKDEIEAEVNKALKPLGVESIAIAWGATVRRAAPRRQEQILPGVKNIIAVASGKGGVGKSTVSVNLAVALAQAGASVGLLDADITGPNIPQMMGIDGKPSASPEGKILPLERHGVKVISIQFFVAEGQPIVWRGPLVGGAIQQFLRDVDWGELDYLVIDLPPGTGDIQLTLAQRVPVAGAVIVTTPQDIALLDAKRGLQMFQKVEVPVLGIVENMATHVCSKCGHEEHVFGEGGGERMARQYHVPLLGSLPLDIRIREQADGGNPSVSAMPESDIAARYRDIARRTAAQLSLQAKNKAIGMPKIVVQNT